METGDGDPGAAVGPPSYAEPVGKVLSGRYIVLGQLGSGAMGTVYDCENFAIGRRVAIKVLDPVHAGRREAVERFQREARAAAQIGHPNIVEVLDMGQTDEGLPYMVMERLDGEDLCAALERTRCLQPAQAVDIVVQVLAALEAAHAAGIVHRDLKPENVFLARRGLRTDFVKILDFGVAKFRDAMEEESSRLTRDGTTVGTPAYMSPEQASGSRDIDARSDLYSAGVLLYEMLSGRLPHEGDTCNAQIVAIVTRDPLPLHELAPWTPPGLVRVVNRAMSRARTERFQTARDFLSALEPFLEAEELVVGLDPSESPRTARGAAGRLSTLELQVPRAWRKRAALVALGLVLACAAVAAILRPSAARPPRIRATSLRASSLPSVASGPAVMPVDIASNPPGATVLLDGAPIGAAPVHALVPSDDGVHVVRVEAPGRKPVERSVSLAGPVRLAIDLEALPSSEPIRSGPPRAGRRPRSSSGLMFDESVYHRGP
ncbi:MAG: serine/threonine protein kinase [Deltaproteobacteria bacterium]|nr:serine/threonine protein kinase [Deltaproteobacteria bacterium]